MMQRTLGVAILGSTGTIGVNTLQVLDDYPDRYRVFALSANTDVEGLWRQCCRYRPAYAVMRNTDAAQALYDKIKSAGLTTEVLCGAEGLEWVASHSHVDYVMAAIVGAAGLLPTLAAAKAGKRILLANKEALVMSGNILMDTIKKYGATLLPIDSEHNAIFQCLPPDYAERGMHGAHVVSIMLTASGGPFRTTPLDALPQVSPQMACAHPNWQMGRKISVDSATMMNKGLEVIEACWLFGIPADMIQVVIHPQSIVHSMVAYADGSVLAQLGSPDMRTPIAYGLAWPQRIHAGVEPLDIFKVAQLDFHKPDLERFPCLNLAYQAIKQGGTATAILNAANEVAVAAFLDERINFVQIATVIEQTLSDIPARPATDLDIVLATDANARLYAEDKVKKLSSRSCRS